MTVLFKCRLVLFSVVLEGLVGGTISFLRDDVGVIQREFLWALKLTAEVVPSCQLDRLSLILEKTNIKN